MSNTQPVVVVYLPTMALADAQPVNLYDKVYFQDAENDGTGTVTVTLALSGNNGFLQFGEIPQGSSVQISGSGDTRVVSGELNHITGPEGRKALRTLR